MAANVLVAGIFRGILLFLVRLLDDGTIPSRRLDRSRHRRVPLDGLLAYARRRETRREGINRIVDEALEAGATY